MFVVVRLFYLFKMACLANLAVSGIMIFMNYATLQTAFFFSYNILF